MLKRFDHLVWVAYELSIHGYEANRCRNDPRQHKTKTRSSFYIFFIVSIPAPCGAHITAPDFVVCGLLRWRRVENRNIPRSFGESFRYYVCSGSYFPVLCSWQSTLLLHCVRFWSRVLMVRSQRYSLLASSFLFIVLYPTKVEASCPRGLFFVWRTS